MYSLVTLLRQSQLKYTQLKERATNYKPRLDIQGHEKILVLTLAQDRTTSAPLAQRQHSPKYRLKTPNNHYHAAGMIPSWLLWRRQELVFELQLASTVIHWHVCHGDGMALDIWATLCTSSRNPLKHVVLSWLYHPARHLLIVLHHEAGPAC